ncbi:uncharacterized protein FIBRA_00826 [Fibroporia radiculosa]|uniref:DUF6535 domain-containing protein n=1 Tax=Fibroporia radiculosa TaxID=599839 RepID=J4I855_9APHY|nr:uncharacterized protein FIBRA_00826 [Fibroporia radiculosa]CCL98821.1 predicted protein [Fibroporia radiculosa]
MVNGRGLKLPTVSTRISLASLRRQNGAGASVEMNTLGAGGGTPHDQPPSPKVPTPSLKPDEPTSTSPPPNAAQADNNTGDAHLNNFATDVGKLGGSLTANQVIEYFEKLAIESTQGKLSIETARAAPSSTEEPGTGEKLSSKDASEGWSECAKQVWEHEAATVEKWKDEIANLLIFAGLFSAVLTTFIFPYFQSLQPQSPNTTTEIINLFSAQLTLLASQREVIFPDPSILNSSMSSSSNGPPSIQSLAINGLWFAALGFSLGAASIAISVNQWLNYHMIRPASLSQQSVRIWYFRHRGLRKWRVPFIISILPILLQVSLILFFVGLVVLLWPFSTVIAGLVLVVVGLLLLVSIGTALLPAIISDCAYKSPQAWWWFIVIRWLKWISRSFVDLLNEQLYSQRIHRWRRYLDASQKFKDWRGFESYFVRMLKEKNETKLSMLKKADAMILDDSFLTDVLRPCLNGSDPNAALPAFYGVLERRAHSSDPQEPEKLQWNIREHDVQAVTMMGHICIDMFLKIAQDIPQSDADPSLSPPSPTRPASQEQLSQIERDRLRIVDHLYYLLQALPPTQLDVYRRLSELWQSQKAYPDRKSYCGILNLISYFAPRYKSKLERDDFKMLLACMASIPKNLSCLKTSIFRLSTTILSLSRELHQRFDCDELLAWRRYTLAAVHDCIEEGVEEAIVYNADEPALSFSLFTRESVIVSDIDAGVLNPGLINALDHFASKCQYRETHDRIQDDLSRLRSRLMQVDSKSLFFFFATVRAGQFD